MNLKFKYLLVFLLVLSLWSCKKKDEENPVVSLKGDSFITIFLNAEFTDPGAEAFDNTDGTLTVEVSGEVNPDFAGTYYIVYTASDAAGNTGQAIRTVVVRNEAEPYNGLYNRTSYTTADTTDQLSTVTVSTILNNRIWVAGFASYQNASVFADISNDTIRFPSQTALAGIPAVTHKFEGSGLIKVIQDTTIFEINFSDSVSGVITNGLMVFKK